MSRLSATSAAASNEPQGRQPLWEAMVAANGAPFTITDVVDATFVSRHTIRSYLDNLVKANIVERIEPPEGATREAAAIRFRIIVEPAPFHAPRVNRKGEPVTQGTGRENMWRSMKWLGEFTPRDLAFHASTDHVPVSETTAKDYCTALRQAGFLKVQVKAQPPKRQAIYRLLEYTGPKAPMIQRTKQVFDPNTQRAHPVAGKT